MENLAQKIRPQTLDDLIGQEKIKSLLENIVARKLKQSFIFYGPSGVGKTTAAFILANSLNLKWDSYNATVENKTSLVKKIQVNELLIIDEFHRLTKQNQEVLLSYLEKGTLVVYSTTTENPFFKILPSIRSRMSLVVFEKISNQDLVLALKKIIQKYQLGLNVEEAWLTEIVKLSNGDLRNTINNVEMLSLIYQDQKVTQEDLKSLLPSLNFTTDKDGDYHYNLLSAFHKSLRGSDVDASLYYGLLIVKSGDLDGFYRRLISVAYEDVGLANPNLELKVNASVMAIERMGFPASYVVLGKIITEVALSPKSNSTTLAVDKWLEIINQGEIFEIPDHLKDAHYRSAAKLGHGISYKFPHDYPFNYVQQTYLPKELANQKIFHFGNNSHEQKMAAFWKKIKEH